MSTKPALGYWNIRGLAEPLRCVLAYAGEDFTDQRYTAGPAPDYNRDEWFNVKFTLGLPFPNLPYYMDNKVKLTGTNAIFRYLGRKYNLDGNTVEEKATSDLVLEVTMDLRNSFVSLCYGSDYSPEKQAKYIEDAKKRLQSFETFLGDKKYFAGETLTVGDFHMYEMLDQHRIFCPTILDNYPKLQQFVERFRSIPAIQKYLSSDKFKERPINNTMANFK